MTVYGWEAGDLYWILYTTHSPFRHMIVFSSFPLTEIKIVQSLILLRPCPSRGALVSGEGILLQKQMFISQGSNVISFKNYHKWVNHSTTDNMLAVSVSFHVYALKCLTTLHQKLAY